MRDICLISRDAGHLVKMRDCPAKCGTVDTYGHMTWTVWGRTLLTYLGVTYDMNCLRSYIIDIPGCDIWHELSEVLHYWHTWVWHMTRTVWGHALLTYLGVTYDTNCLRSCIIDIPGCDIWHELSEVIHNWHTWVWHMTWTVWSRTLLTYLGVTYDMNCLRSYIIDIPGCDICHELSEVVHYWHTWVWHMTRPVWGRTLLTYLGMTYDMNSLRSYIIDIPGCDIWHELSEVLHYWHTWVWHMTWTVWGRILLTYLGVTYDMNCLRSYIIDIPGCDIWHELSEVLHYWHTWVWHMTWTVWGRILLTYLGVTYDMNCLRSYIIDIPGCDIWHELSEVLHYWHTWVWHMTWTVWGRTLLTYLGVTYDTNCLRSCIIDIPGCDIWHELSEVVHYWHTWVWHMTWTVWGRTLLTYLGVTYDMNCLRSYIIDIPGCDIWHELSEVVCSQECFLFLWRELPWVILGVRSAWMMPLCLRTGCLQLRNRLQTVDNHSATKRSHIPYTRYFMLIKKRLYVLV